MADLNEAWRAKQQRDTEAAAEAERRAEAYQSRLPALRKAGEENAHQFIQLMQSHNIPPARVYVWTYKQPSVLRDIINSFRFGSGYREKVRKDMGVEGWFAHITEPESGDDLPTFHFLLTDGKRILFEPRQSRMENSVEYASIDYPETDAESCIKNAESDISVMANTAGVMAAVDLYIR